MDQKADDSSHLPFNFFSSSFLHYFVENKMQFEKKNISMQKYNQSNSPYLKLKCINKRVCSLNKNMVLCLLVACSIHVLYSCNSNNSYTATSPEQPAVPEDSPSKENRLILIPQILEIGLPEGLTETGRKQTTQTDSIFYDLEMGIHPMDLEFNILLCQDDSLTIDQQEEQKLFLTYDGKTLEHPSTKSYRSQWYLLPYVLEKKFRFTTFKHEDDYETLSEDPELKLTSDSFEGIATSLLSSEIYTTRYFIRLKTGISKGNKTIVFIINIPVGC